MVPGGGVTKIIKLGIIAQIFSRLEQYTTTSHARNRHYGQ